MDQEVQVLQKKKTSKPLLIVLGIILFVLVVEAILYFFVLGHPKITFKKQASYCSQLDSLTENFVTVKREIDQDTVTYTLEGKILGVELKNKSVIYRLDLGKNILLGSEQKIDVPLAVLPVKYFSREVLGPGDLALTGTEPNSSVIIKLQYQKPCSLTAWEINAPYVLQKIVTLPEKDKVLEIAGATLAWLDGQKNENGVYIEGKLCGIDGKCEVSSQSNRAGVAVVWARFKYYQAKKEDTDLQALVRDLKTYTDPAKVPVIQNDFWNCKLMYEMWQSNLLSEWQKQAVEKICWNSSYPLLKEIDSPDLAGVINNRPSPSGNYSQLSAFGGQIIEYSAVSADFSSRYLWKKNEEDLQKAIGFFNLAVDLYAKETSGDYLSGRWDMGIASLDLYLATGEKRYLDFAVALPEKEKLEETCLNSPYLSNYCRQALSEKAIAIIFLRQLYQATKNVNYNNLAEKLIQKVLETDFDAKDYEGFFVGDNAFNSYGPGFQKEKVNVFKPVRYNGLMAGILSEIK